MSNDDWMSKSLESDEFLFGNEWLSLRKTPGGFTYSHEEKGGGQGVAVLAYKLQPLQIVGRFEECPPHRDGRALCAITGQMDVKGESPVDAAVRELKEEAGIEVPNHALRELGFVNSSKQTDTIMWLFAVDVCHLDIGESQGDGTRGEKGAFCHWIAPGPAIWSKDPLLSTMIFRAGLAEEIQHLGNEIRRYHDAAEKNKSPNPPDSP